MKKFALSPLPVIAALALGVLSLPNAASAAAETYSVDKNHSEVTFQIRHLISKVGGSFNDFAGTIVMDAAKPENSSVEFTIQAASIDTRNERRDGHLKTADFFDTATHPTITFKSTKIASAGAANQYHVTGNFTMRGVTKELTLPVTFLGTMKDGQGNTKAGFETSVKLNRKDYGISWNANLDQGGVVLGDDVEATINLQAAVPKPAAPKPATN